MELLQTMQVFARLAELGSFTRTAEALQIGRPQVTRAIQELEASLGVRLLQRTTRQVRLTAEGEQFYERVKGILGSIADATSMFGRPGATLRGKLRIDIPTAFAQLPTFQSLYAFNQCYPDIELILGVSDRTVDLVAEGVDCVLRIGDLPDSSLVARTVGYATMVTCAAPSYLRQFGTPSALDELDSHQGVNFLSGQNGRPLPWQFREGSSDRKHISRSGITLTESNAYVMCAVAGFGIIQAPGVTVDHYLQAGTLVEILPAYRPRPRTVSVLYPSRTHLAPQVHVFIEWIRHHLSSIFGRWLEPHDD
ncbi:LysR family transcriptional regulator [Pseudomonas sp. ZM23]|uniref:LysR family transcriptional regulator n=1 Tax=Pseudomonas triclosanedens TaxID=2961893 RepID=A0ABY6ZRL5_9PSED|nr:LysR family transcriptional regulator [Pseudomonas triclosanedens]MCP8467530.1 LysR family transcriptional regulator [Pseudomonas triclosanedens]MCP8471707.1 LysR family transcriptional regulator [Pseudomonas triclosanedens]MCP8478940.1 LysR family transcriptional regulator [Pseudomonas triclosanedens]WAI47006.1 LysR family transcriptional regulator [Pseudomonas triclosanedens]